MPLDITIRVWYNGPLRTGQQFVIYKCNKDTGNYFMLRFFLGVIVGVIFARPLMDFYYYLLAYPF